MSVLIALLLSVNIYGVDVSSFDIKGLSLNSSYNDVLKAMPCVLPRKGTSKTDSGEISSWYITCDNQLFVDFNRNKKIIGIGRWVDFDTNPNWDKLKSRIIKKYGNPNKDIMSVPGYRNPNKGFNKEMCWGDCRIKYENNRYTKGKFLVSNHTRKQFGVKYSTWSENSNYRQLSLHLSDPKLKLENQNWQDSKNKLWEKEQKEKANNIDL